MIRIINIQNKSSAIEKPNKYKNKQYPSIDIRFENVHLKELNEVTGINLFFKNNLYIGASTLWEIMQPEGQKNTHNSHNLNSGDIIDALSNITSPNYVIKAKHGRYAILSNENASIGEPLIIIIEIGAGINDNIKANINKIVTIYPKSSKRNIQEKDIIYKSK